MATYVILNLLIITIVCITLRIVPHRPRKPWAVMFLCLMLLTLVFDNIMIAFGLFSYAPDKILGIFIGRAPIEDFMYPLLAAILIPSLWNIIGGKHAR